MLIANPLYDTAFKELIRDPEVARAIIETLTGNKVHKIKIRETEHNKPQADEDKRPKFFRMDYSVEIENERGELHSVLVEMQKASGAEHILRFREYLAVAGYMPKKEESIVPVMTIYFLGFNLGNVKTPCLKVARNYVDMLSNKVLDTKEKFVELLTHDSYIIQATRIKIDGQPKSKLEKILSIFEQRNFADDKEETLTYDYGINEDYQRKMVDILHYIGTEPSERKKLDEEAYWKRFEDFNEGAVLKLTDELARKNKDIAEKDLALQTQQARIAELEKLLNKEEK
ncbi:hypothetical protein AGMMS49938_07230 [Fibrobacterales bacterium]|nr:hypothetical protein AGMMS49938_07230 [Fibrobacterales bacterium]